MIVKYSICIARHLKKYNHNGVRMVQDNIPKLVMMVQYYNDLNRVISIYRTGYQSAGPALPGTSCGGGGLSCYEGRCEHHRYEHPPKAPEPPKWSEWSKGPCRTPCIEGASPVKHNHRFCESFSGCEGSDTQVEVRGLLQKLKTCN